MCVGCGSVQVPDCAIFESGGDVAAEKESGEKREEQMNKKRLVRVGENHDVQMGQMEPPRHFTILFVTLADSKHWHCST